MSRVMLMICISPGSHNACARYLLCCLKCCFWCLENFIKFINRNAYIMVSSRATVLAIVWTVKYIFIGSARTSVFYCPLLSPLHLFSPTDSNIWEELLHLFQGSFLPLDEECYSVRPLLVSCVSTTRVTIQHLPSC